MYESDRARVLRKCELVFELRPNYVSDSVHRRVGIPIGIPAYYSAPQGPGAARALSALRCVWAVSARRGPASPQSKLVRAPVNLGERQSDARRSLRRLRNNLLVSTCAPPGCACGCAASHHAAGNA